MPLHPVNEGLTKGTWQGREPQRTQRGAEVRKGTINQEEQWVVTGIIGGLSGVCYFCRMLGTLTESEIAEVLQNNLVCRVGCNDGQRTYVVPISYVFMGDHILCHSYLGMKIEMMRMAPDVCFEVDEIKDYNNWRCVIVWGNYEELTEEKDITEARQYFSEEMLEMKVSETALPPEEQPERWHNRAPGQRVSVYYRIRFTAVSGRFERVM